MALRRCAAAVLALAVFAGGCDEDLPSADRGLRAALGGIGGTGFAKAETPRTLRFPADHGAHPRHRSEWWYVNAVLSNAAGREFGVQFTLFRQGLEPRQHMPPDEGPAAWRSGQVFMGHAAVSDLGRQRHHHAERASRGHPALAGVRAAPFAAYIEGWRLASTGERFLPLRMEADAERFAFDLVLAGPAPVVAQGDRGLSAKGPNNASYYYSIPRIAASGQLVVDGEEHRVAGDAWLDHEWSTSVLAPEYAGWDWMALRLDDGRDLMVFQMRRQDGAASDYDAGMILDAAGGAKILTAADFALRPLRHWREWPVAWRLALEGETGPWHVRAAFAEQLMETSVRYWEGVAVVENPSGERIGVGYLEMTGHGASRLAP